MPATAVTDATFEREVLESEIPVLVSFSAPWCRPCKAIQPWLDTIGEARAGALKVCSVDIDSQLGVPSRYGVLSIPTVIVFDRGEPRATLIGPRPRRAYEEAVASVLS